MRWTKKRDTFQSLVLHEVFINLTLPFTEPPISMPFHTPLLQHLSVCAVIICKQINSLSVLTAWKHLEGRDLLCLIHL